LKITCLHIRDLQIKKDLSAWLLDFPAVIKEDILGYRFEKDQWRVLGGKVLLQKELMESNADLKLEQLSYTEKGKPYFENVGFQFNISHSGDWVALVTDEKNPCGVDIEMHRKINWNLFESNFTPTEWQTILIAPDPRLQFFEYWAIKESVIKADGRGVAVLKKTALIAPNQVVCEDKIWHIHPFQPADGYSGCVASEYPFEKVDLQIIKFH
jgi:4'-phosphopantetheinyl transferase